MNIMYFTRTVYGKVNIYVVGGEGEEIEKLTGKKTVTARDLGALVNLGHTVEQVDDDGMALGPFGAGE